MPKVAIFFFILLFSPMMTSSHAFIPVDLNNIENVQNSVVFDSDILKVDPDFFVENNFKRYLIFGNSLDEGDFLKSNSIYGIESDNGFFSVSILSETLASNLISQGVLCC